MLEQIAAAFEQKDYRTAAKLVQELLRQSPQNPWAKLYGARLQEISGNSTAAAAIYRQLLQETPNPKLAIQARQGLQRLETAAQAQRQAEITQATADPQNAAPGLLILEAVTGDAKSIAAQHLAQIMQLDAYTARMQIPHRGWRIHRVGPIGELQFYGQQLKAAEIPVFWTPVAAAQSLPVFSVLHFQLHEPTATVICQNDQGQIGSLSFTWSEVSQRVEGLLPIFEHVVDSHPRTGIQRQRKRETQDYAHVCDLHLFDRRCILRLCDLTYQFHQGINFLSDETIDQNTNRLYWNHLQQFIGHYLPQSPWSDFTAFAEATLNQPLLLQKIDPHLQLLGQDNSLWNPAFQLYSSLVFLRNRAA
jgi:antitoxin component HigA of HigAB toxin-antitoxin module